MPPQRVRGLPNISDAHHLRSLHGYGNVLGRSLWPRARDAPGLRLLCARLTVRVPAAALAVLCQARKQHDRGPAGAGRRLAARHGKANSRWCGGGQASNAVQQ